MQGEGVGTGKWSGQLVHNPATGMYDIMDEAHTVVMDFKDLQNEFKNLSPDPCHSYCVDSACDPLKVGRNTKEKLWAELLSCCRYSWKTANVEQISVTRGLKFAMCSLKNFGFYHVNRN